MSTTGCLLLIVVAPGAKWCVRIEEFPAVARSCPRRLDQRALEVTFVDCAANLSCEVSVTRL